MSLEPNKNESTRVMLSQLLLVMLGLAALLLLTVVIGALADRYYAGRQYEKSTELEKQDAFTKGLTYEEYRRAMTQGAQAQSDLSQSGVADAGSGQPSAAQEPPQTAATDPSHATAPGSAIAPPDFNVSREEIDDMAKKAAFIHTTIGSIPIDFRPDLAPQAVKNFLYLAGKGFYDGMAFYRAYSGTFVQTGSPTGRLGGSAGYSWPLPQGKLYPEKGTIAFLASVGEDNCGSEFCIFTDDAEILIQQCVVFAKVADRYNIVEKMLDSRSDKDGYLLDRVYITKVEIVDKSTAAAPLPN